MISILLELKKEPFQPYQERKRTELQETFKKATIPPGGKAYSIRNDQNEIIAAVAIKPKPENRHMWENKGWPIQAAITFFGIKPQYTSQGYGMMLFDEALKHYNRVGIKTGHSSSQDAQWLYHKFGFRIIDEDGPVKYWYYERK